MPELKGLLQTTGQKITRSFQTEWYTPKDWLCGCATRNRLFCFPCLLFSTCDNVWTNTGFCDSKNLPRSLSKHERSTTHIQSQIALKTFGSSRIDLALNQQRRLNISIHNAKVKENREILKDLMNVTCFLAKQELAFCGNDESTSSSNRGNYVELLHAFVEKDERLARASYIWRYPLCFLACQTEYRTISLKQLAFWGFDDVSDDRRAPAIAEYGRFSIPRT